MGHYAKTLIEKIPPGSFVGTFHSLLGNICTECHKKDISVNDICEIFLQKNIISDKFDILIIDEAQDLMNTKVLKVLDLLIEKGLSDGQWFFFYDPNQNIYEYVQTYEDAFKYLNDNYRPAHIPLTINCRNTKNIAETNSMLTGINAAHILKIDGPETKEVSYTDNIDLCNKVANTIKNILYSGVSEKDIVILSKYQKQNSGIANLSQIGLCKINVNPSMDFHKKHDIDFYTTHTFKGLERKYVLCIDIDDFNDQKSRLLNYVAFSRAKEMLYIFYENNVIEQYQQKLL